MLKNIYPFTKNILSNGQSLSLLFARLAVAYGFYDPAMQKWSDISSVATWFGSIGIPFPTLNAYMAASTELIGVVLLTLGLFTRLISIPLIVIMVVAITTVTLCTGFVHIFTSATLHVFATITFTCLTFHCFWCFFS